MAYSFVQYTGNGINTLFNVPFGYISKSHVTVKVNGVSTSFTWNSDTVVSVSPAPANLAVVEVRRTTPVTTAVVDFQDAGTITEAMLDENTAQMLYIAQEAFDAADLSIQLASDNTWDAESKRIKNLATPTAATDAATKAYADSTVDAAAVHATNAANSATAAQGSADAAAASYDNFDDRYLGPKAAAPALDNDGSALLVGALYFDTALNEMRVWNGTSWVQATSGASLADTADVSKGDALVGFKQSDGGSALSGAVARTVHTKLQEFVSVRDFGAVGNGVTDDRAAIQTAYNTANAAGLGLHFPRGDYLVGQDSTNGWSLLFNGNVLLRGEGPQSRLLGNGDYALIRVSESGTTDYVDIANIRFDNAGTGSFSAENQQWCLRIHKAVKSLKISGCTFENFNEDAIYLGFNNSVLVKDAIITGNHFTNGGRTGIALISVNGFVISDNIFDDIDFQPIDIEPDINTYSAVNGIIKGNIIRGGGAAAFASTRAAIGVNHKSLAAASVSGKIVIVDNVISSYGSGLNLAHGIQTNFQNKIVIKGNTVVDVKDRGINVQDTADVLVMGNVVTGGVYGLVINNSTRVYEGPNYFQGQSTTARSFTASTGLSLVANVSQGNQEFYKDGSFVAEVFGTNGVLSEASALVKDGIPAPAATNGYAAIFVDVADGDLKVRFGDGITKTIATDI